MGVHCPSVSVIINTLNRAAYLDDAIAGVFQLDYPQLELIVVNGPSTDNTLAVLERWRDRIKIRQCDVANLSVSRNVGVAAAAGDIVAFLDDDAVPHPDWLNRIVPHYANPRVGAAGGFTVDNTGVRWQVRKTICDRYGNAHFVDEFFDERRLNFAGTPFYPSLLGTNSSFRRNALYAIGGFDHTFAYLLDETDVCLRLVDAGWHVHYEPDALIFHQFAASHVRSTSRKPRTLYPSVVSKSYFILRHGVLDGRSRQAWMLESYEKELLTANGWLQDNHHISADHRTSLDLDVKAGVRDGTARATQALAAGKARGDLAAEAPDAPFMPIAATRGIRVALVSQGYPPDGDAGIARWTHMVANGLARIGVRVHVITRSQGQASRRFQDGLWVHRIPNAGAASAAIANRYDVPEPDHARWMAAVMEELRFLKTFGLDCVSFPIWDLEALPVLDDPDLTAVLSLHTTYLMARPYKPEWNQRVLFGRKVVDKMIAAECAALSRAPHILANSDSIVAEIEQGYGISLAGRYRVIPHGTPDLIAASGLTIDDHLARRAQDQCLNVLFAGRFERRKGYDLVLELARLLDRTGKIRIHCVGQPIDPVQAQRVERDTGIRIDALSHVEWHGAVSRARLDELYCEADVVLMPSRFESFGLVAIEAMAAAVPVVGLANAALNEVIEPGRSGWLFDEASFVRETGALLRELAEDRHKLAAISHSAHDAYQERFSDIAMAKAIADFYGAAIAARKGA